MTQRVAWLLVGSLGCRGAQPTQAPETHAAARATTSAAPADASGFAPPPQLACVGEPAAERVTLKPGDKHTLDNGWTVSWTAWKAELSAASLTLSDGAGALQVTASGPMPQLVPVLTGCWRVERVEERALTLDIKPTRTDLPDGR